MASLCYLLDYNQTSIPGLPVLAEYQSGFHFEFDPIDKEFNSQLRTNAPFSSLNKNVSYANT